MARATGEGTLSGWRWTVLSDGWTQAREALLIRGGSWRKIVRCAATAVLLESDRFGPVLFDCGYSSRFASETAQWPGRLYRHLAPATLTEPDGIAGLLQKRGLDPGKLPRLIVSHWHADHVGGLRDFPNAIVHASREGWQAVSGLRGMAALRHGVLPGLLPEDLPDRLRWVGEGSDLFGDGSMVVLSLPGHAVGQIGIRFQAGDGSPVLLAADACWLSEGYRLNRSPHPITGLLQDLRACQATVERLHRLHLAEPSLRILPCHCPETLALVPV
ncbi:MAG: MBL fold metallo-hydrolase [Verrucomicrobia bacterium]|nr:MBL fold metallo-hydrolase [Verrucomicrobiota bacterium]